MDKFFVLWTKVLLAMMHHILVQPLLNLHFILQFPHHLCEMWETLCSERKPQKSDERSEAPQLNLH
jgi:hypothetical protein